MDMYYGRAAFVRAQHLNYKAAKPQAKRLFYFLRNQKTGENYETHYCH